MTDEERIYKSWKLRFGYPSTPLERSAGIYWRSVKKISSASEHQLYRRFQDTQIVFVGDDAQSKIQGDMLAPFLRGLGKNSAVLLTNRRVRDPLCVNYDQTQMMCRQRRIPIRPLAEDLKTVESQIGRIVKTKKKVLVWTGHLRLSLWLSKQFLSSFEPLYVFLQNHHLRWQFSSQSGWKKPHENVFAFLGSSPLIGVDRFRGGNDEYVDSPEKIEFHVRTLQKEISALFGHMKIKQTAKPKVLHPFLKKPMSHLLGSETKVDRFIKTRILLGESATLPDENLMLICTLNASHICEEVAHYLRTVHLAGKTYGFYATVVEEALAFFVSVLFYPTRSIPSFPKKPNTWDLVHFQGYQLGFQLYKTWKRSKTGADKIMQLWHHHPSDEQEAKKIVSMVSKWS